MKTEALETLLLDHALGALAPEVGALLEAHLAQDPVAARHAADFAETLRLARVAVSVPVAPPHRPLDTTRLRHARRQQWSAARRTELLRLAACLLLGLGLGWFIRTGLGGVDFAPPPIVVVSVPPKPEPSVRFWSVARFAPGANTAETSPRWHWNSPTGAPPATSLR